MAGIKIVDLPALGRDLLSTDLLELSIGGTASRKITGQEIMNASKLNVGSTPIVSGTVGRLLFQGTGDILQQSSSLFWDSTNNRLGVGTSTPFWGLHYNTDGGLNVGMFSSYGNTNTFESLLYLYRGRGTQASPSAVLSGDNLGSLRIAGQYSSIVGQYTTGAKIEGVATENWSVSANGTYLGFHTTTTGTASMAERMRIFASGNVGINTTTDAGFKLDVNGTARVSGVLTAAGNYVQYGTNANVGIGSTSNGFGFATNGTALLYASANIFTTQVYAHNFFTGNFTAASGTQGVANYTGATFAPTSGTAAFNTINATPTINQTGGANGITRGLYINPTLTAAADFRAIETTAGNVIFNGGNVGIGTTSPITAVEVKRTGSDSWITASRGNNSFHAGFLFNPNGSWSPSNVLWNFGLYANTNDLRYWTYNGSTDTTVLNLFGGTGNVAIGTTTDAGYKLDVNGTARVSGVLTCGNNVTAANFIGNIRSDLFLTSNGAFFIFQSSGATGNAKFNQFVSIGTNNEPVASAALDVVSTTKGFLPPRMTNAQRTAIVSPAVGLIVYCTDVTEGLWVYKSTGWTFIV